MVENKADVSVIIPVYNSGKEAFRAVQSVAGQTQLPREVILIDDASPDKEETKHWLTEIEKTFGDSLDITVLYQEKNGGAGEARNAGWDIAKGKYIAFLDSDDIWHPRKIEIQYAFMEAHPEIGISRHQTRVITEEGIQDFSGEIVSLTEEKIIPINPVRALFKHYGKGGPSVLMVAEDENIIRFAPGKRYTEDMLFWWLWYFRRGGVLIDTYLAASFKEFYGESGLSSNLWKMEKGELENFRILRKEGLISWPLCIAGCAFSFLKYIRRVIICAMR